jgi:hypothetical protein
MSALGELDVSKLSAATDSTTIKAIINSLFWTWFKSQDSNHGLFKISIFHGLVKHTVTLGDIEPMFELIFGPPIKS